MEKNGVRILVVDDEVGMRCFLAAALGIKGYQIVTARDGLEAIELAKKEKFALIICDVIMPRMDGFAMAEEVRKISPDAKIIMISGHDVHELAPVPMKKTAHDFIQKPFEMEEMAARVEKALV